MAPPTPSPSPLLLLGSSPLTLAYIASGTDTINSIHLAYPSLANKMFALVLCDVVQEINLPAVTFGS